MATTRTRLNPTAPSFPPSGVAMAPQGDMPPTPPAEELLPDGEDNNGARTFDKTTLPAWALVEENEKLQVAALSLAKTSTRDEWIARLQEFADLLAPGCRITSPVDGTEMVAWKPLAVRQMPPALQPDLTTHGATFSLDFIHNELRGIEWSPGFYYISPKDRLYGTKFTAYWILDADLDPYLPKQPGEHGAKLTPFFNSTLSDPGMAPTEEDYLNTPVFIANNYTCGYRYYGHYSQTRFSDKLDYERMVDGTVPPFVLDVWAKNLTQKDKEPWLKDALRGHIWPKPTYIGPLPLSSLSALPGSGTPQAAEEKSQDHERCVQKAIKRYSEELQEWEIGTKLKLSLLKESDIHRLFRAADSDQEVGLRLWFEYLQCISYENNFYERMVEVKYNERLQRGYSEKVRDMQALGWRWQKVESVSGSGHSITVDKLRPPQRKVSMPVARKDSVIGYEQELFTLRGMPSRVEEIIEKSVTQPASMDFETAPKALGDPRAHTPQPNTLPPHLRGKASKQNTTPLSTKPISIATTEKEQKVHTTSDIKTVDQASKQSNPFPTGDLAAAKNMASSYTKAKARYTGGDSQSRGRSSNPKPVDRNDPMNQGWAKAGRNPKVVPQNRDPNVGW